MPTPTRIDLNRPPAEWFVDPELAEPTPVTVTDEGRVFGHIAAWGTCHVGIPGTCVTPPRSQNRYASFLLGGRRVKGFATMPDGEKLRDPEIAVGTITLGTGHANLRLDAARTAAHYDDTGTAVADVHVGEDDWGPWYAGALRPGLAASVVTQLRAAKISGDWRADRTTGALELVGMLAVNVPGFPIERPQIRLAASAAPGHDPRAALVASNVIPRDPVIRRALVAGLSAYEAEVAKGQVDALYLRARLPELMARAIGSKA